MEVNDEVYDKITELCEEGDFLVENERYDEGLAKYYEALELVPVPKDDWEASTWIYVAIGDTYYIMDESEKALNNFFEALKCPDGLGNAFVNLRIGQCFYELDNIEKAKLYLLQAYIVEGEEIFENEDDIFYQLIADEITNEVLNNGEDKNQEYVHVSKEVDDELAIQISDYEDKSYEDLCLKNYENAIKYLKKAWDLIPDDKFSYDESYYLSVSFVECAILTNNIEMMSEWISNMNKNGLSKLDDGEREKYFGILEYEKGNLEKAFELFALSSKKSCGLAFNDIEEKYKDFYFKELNKK